MANIPSESSCDAQSRPADTQYRLEPKFLLDKGEAEFDVVGPDYEPLDYKSDKIRLIKIDRDADQEKGVAFELVEANLTDRPSFTALSYVCHPRVPIKFQWSSKDDGGKSSPMWLAKKNGNLYLALRYLRDNHHCDLLWADAISINQTDPAEKSHQVAQMHRIYQTASEVIAWLGPFDILQPYVKQLHDWAEFGRVKRAVNDRPDPLWLQDDNLESLLSHDSHHLEGLPDMLLSLDYWERAWIFQEMTNAIDMHFIIGDESFTRVDLIAATHAWKRKHTLTQFLISMHNRNWGAEREPPKIPRQDVIKHYQSLAGGNPARTMVDMVAEARRRSSDSSPEQPWTISLEFLQRFTRLSATDPRDLIFALWGYVDNNGSHAELLRPDYSLEAVQVFINAATYFVRTEKSLRILKCQSWKDSDLVLPCWVPDWGKVVFGCDQDTTEYYTNARAALLEDLPPYDGDFDRVVKIVSLPDTTSLQVAGIRHVHIVEFLGATILPFRRDDSNEPQQNLIKHVLFGPSVGNRTSLYQFVQLLNLLVDFGDRGALTSIYDKLDFQSIQLATPHPDFPSAAPQGRFEAADYWADVMAARYLGISNESVSGTNERNALVKRNFGTNFTRTTGNDPTFKFFRTSDSSIGACHTRVNVKEDDVVCQFAAYPELFILRKADDGYKPVGECIIPDMRVGQLNPEDLDWFRFM